VEFRDIEYFAVLAEHGNVGRAAEALGLSAPALSVSLRRLETAMRVKLFNRTPKGVELTPTGSALLAQVKRLRLAREDVLREATDLSEGRAGHLRIGAGPAACIALLPLACEELVRELPAVTLKIVVGTLPPLIEQLRNGESDLAVMPLPTTPNHDLIQETLYDDQMVVYCSIHHHLAKKRNRLTLADIAEEEWASTQTTLPSSELLNRVLRENGFPARKVRVEAASHQIVNHLVATSNLLGFNSRFVVRQATPRYRFAELRIRELAHARHQGLLYRKDGYLSPAARRFVEILRATARKISAATSAL
jgi:DNA-binding transcriptional LysR family regulator